MKAENQSGPSVEGQTAAEMSTKVQTSPLPESLFYTIPEAASALHVCTKTIRRLLDRGILTCCKVLRKKLIPRQQIADFLKKTCDTPFANL